MNIPIKKHTKIRRPISRWQLEYMLFENNPVLISNTLKMSIPPIKVQDISMGLENPLYTGREYPYRKEDLIVEFQDSPLIPKLSIWQRIKEWGKKGMRKSEPI